MNKIVLLPIIIIVIIYFIIAQLIPSVTMALELKKQRDEKIVEIEKVKKQKDDLTKFMNSVDNHQDEFNFVSNFIPKDPKENDIINILDKKAKENNISLFIIDPKDKILKESTKDKSSIAMNFSETAITITGSYEDIKKFLTEVFFIDRIYSFDSLVIEKVTLNKTKEKSTSSSDLNVRMTFNYKYVSNDLSISTSDVSNGLKEEYDFINKIMDLSNKLKEFEKAEPGRVNPFIPS